MSDYERYVQIGFIVLYLTFIWFFGGVARNELTRLIRSKLFDHFDAWGLTHGWLMYATAPFKIANYPTLEYRKNGVTVGKEDLDPYEYKKWFVRNFERPDLIPLTLAFFANRAKEKKIDFDEVLFQ